MENNSMIQLNDLRKELIEVPNDELRSVVGGGDYAIGYQTSPLTGINTGNVGVGIGSTSLGYNTSNLSGKTLSETYSLSTQVAPGVTVGGSFEGVSNSASGNLGYKTDNFSGNIYASPTAIGFQLGGKF
jgi:hypothetical protein